MNEDQIKAIRKASGCVTGLSKLRNDRCPFCGRKTKKKKLSLKKRFEEEQY